MTDNSVVFEKHGRAFWITINRPEKRNAINGDVVAGIAKGYRDAHDDPRCPCDRSDRAPATRHFAPARTCRTAVLLSPSIIPGRMSTTPI